MSDTIKEAFNTLGTFVTREMTRKASPRDAAEAEAVIAAGMFLLEQFFQDFHRVTEAIESIDASIESMRPR